MGRKKNLYFLPTCFLGFFAGGIALPYHSISYFAFRIIYLPWGRVEQSQVLLSMAVSTSVEKNSNSAVGIFGVSADTQSHPEI